MAVSLLEKFASSLRSGRYDCPSENELFNLFTAKRMKERRLRQKYSIKVEKLSLLMSDDTVIRKRSVVNIE